MEVSNTDLVLYADGSLHPERKLRIQRKAERNYELANTLSALEASRLPYKAAFDSQTLPLVPDKLRAHVRTWTRIARETESVFDRKYGGDPPFFMALVACFLFFIAAIYSFSDDNDALDNRVQDTTQTNERVALDRLVSYQSLYVPVTVEESELTLAATKNTIVSLSESSGMKIVTPDLSHEGYEFVRIQELGYAGQPLIQLVYTKEGRMPLGIYFLATPERKDSKTHFELLRNLITANWIRQNQWFVLIADEGHGIVQQIQQRIDEEFSSL